MTLVERVLAGLNQLDQKPLADRRAFVIRYMRIAPECVINSVIAIIKVGVYNGDESAKTTDQK